MASLANSILARFFLLTAVWLASAYLGWQLWLGSETPVAGLQKSPPLPDVVIFSIDTLRADHLGCYGYNRHTSPTIDALAGEAVLFRRVVSQAPNTAPAHMTMLTGVNPAVHGVHNYARLDAPVNVLPQTIPTLATLLRPYGFYAAGLTNAGNVSPALGFGQGFDEYSDCFFTPAMLYDNPGATEKTSIDQLRGVLMAANSRKQPLFLFLHHTICHKEYFAAPVEYRERFADALLAGLPRSVVELRARKEWWGDDYHAVADIFQGSDLRHRAHMAALYDGAVAYSDHTVKLIINELRQAGRWDNTLFIVTSDHGEELQEHGNWGHELLWGEHLRVPLLLKLPGGDRAGVTVTQPVQTVDLAPTVLAVLSLPVPETMQGRSLLPLLAGETPPPVLVSYQPAGNREADMSGMRVTADGYTWFWHNGESQREYLFAESDTAELHNLAAGEPARCREMRALVGAQLATDRALRVRLLAGDTGPVE